MEMNETLSVLFFTAAIFSVGFGVGEWFSERSHRKDIAASNRGRINISMPANQEDAQTMLALLSDLIGKAEAERNARLDAE